MGGRAEFGVACTKLLRSHVCKMPGEAEEGERGLTRARGRSRVCAGDASSCLDLLQLMLHVKPINPSASSLVVSGPEAVGLGALLLR